MGWVKDFFDQVIKLQGKILHDFSEAERREGYGNAARVIVPGPEGGIFYLWFTERGIDYKPADIPVRNTLYIGTEDTLLNMITPDVSLEELVCLIQEESVDAVATKLKPLLDPRTAFSNGLIFIGNEDPNTITTANDSERWAQVFDKFLHGVAFPITIRQMLKGAK
jgi:hypothetical protein